jgi:arginine decarboxylase
LTTTKLLDRFKPRSKENLKLEFCIAAEEEPNLNFIPSRLGIGYKNIVSFLKNRYKQVD